eukprot:TRINITY_DN5855_c2_g1_i1.p2 TRINITY_DN5855_c2_g1~~TRINITY_DN5855_c2_g1_i1.p2  ORF type:complete len:108 (-),score=16.89 TRINITY_DN5855_c2_g1_i1:66-389(-)
MAEKTVAEGGSRKSNLQFCYDRRRCQEKIERVRKEVADQFCTGDRVFPVERYCNITETDHAQKEGFDVILNGEIICSINPESNTWRCQGMLRALKVARAIEIDQHID